MKPMHRNLVAAVRWDYEIGLLSRADLARKYRAVLGLSSVYDIAARRIYPEIKSVRHATAWCKLSWAPGRAGA